MNNPTITISRARQGGARHPIEMACEAAARMTAVTPVAAAVSRALPNGDTLFARLHKAYCNRIEDELRCFMIKFSQEHGGGPMDGMMAKGLAKAVVAGGE